MSRNQKARNQRQKHPGRSKSLRSILCAHLVPLPSARCLSAALLSCFGFSPLSSPLYPLKVPFSCSECFMSCGGSDKRGEKKIPFRILRVLCKFLRQSYLEQTAAAFSLLGRLWFPCVRLCFWHFEKVCL